MKYQVIYADPPWQQSKGGKKSVRPNSSGEKLDYQVISLTEIEKHFWNMLDYTDTNSVLFLWTIDKYLWEAERLAKEHGWKLHARMVWNKVTGIPAAFTIRFGHEYLLYFYRGKFLPVAKEERGKIHSVFTEQVKRHSQKPEIAYQIIERLYPNTNKLEMYARNKRNGWDVWGNEVESDVDLAPSK
jgi:N6-adenosine-specific RNA methylase IME4